MKLLTKENFEDNRGISVKVNASCIVDFPEHSSFLNFDLPSENFAGLKNKFNFDGHVDEGYTMVDLENAFYENPCVLAVIDQVAIEVASNTPNGVQIATTNDSDIGSQGHHQDLSYADAVVINSLIPPETPFVNVAVLDTGIDYNHPDLSCNMWSEDGLLYGVDLVNGDDDPMDDHVGSHGTHVAGLIGACGNNGVGGAGVIGSGVNLMGVKVMNDQGVGSITSLANGINWAVEHGADIINLSVQAPSFSVQESNFLEEAILDAVASGVTIVGAAGNDSLNLADNPVLPAEFSFIKGMISVGSYDSNSQQFSSFSNYGPSFLDIAAPGAEESFGGNGGFRGLYSTVRGGQYARLAGTSQAAPIVAGAAALVYRYISSHNVVPSPALVEFYLKEKGSYFRPDLGTYVEDAAALNFQAIAGSLLEDEGALFPATAFGRCNR